MDNLVPPELWNFALSKTRKGGRGRKREGESGGGWGEKKEQDNTTFLELYLNYLESFCINIVFTWKTNYWKEYPSHLHLRKTLRYALIFVWYIQMHSENSMFKCKIIECINDTNTHVPKFCSHLYVCIYTYAYLNLFLPSPVIF